MDGYRPRYNHTEMIRDPQTGDRLNPYTGLIRTFNEDLEKAPPQAEDVIDPNAGGLRVPEGVHWRQVLDITSTSPAPEGSEYDKTRHLLHDTMAAMQPREGQTVEERRQELHWPEPVRLSDAQTRGYPIALHDWIPDCVQVAVIAAQETARIKGLGRHVIGREITDHEIFERTALDIFERTVKHGLSHPIREMREHVENGAFIIIRDDAARLLEKNRDHVSLSILKAVIHEKGEILDPGDTYFHRPDLRPIGKIAADSEFFAGEILIRDATWLKQSAPLGRALVTESELHHRLLRYLPEEPPGLLESLKERRAVLQASDIQRAIRAQPPEPDDALSPQVALFTLEHVAGYPYVETGQAYGNIYCLDGVALEWRGYASTDKELINFVRGIDGHMRFHSYNRLGTEQPVGIANLSKLIEEHHAVTLMVSVPLEGELFRPAQHAITVHRLHYENNRITQVDYLENGPKDAIERSGSFLAKPGLDGILPIASFYSARSATMSVEELNAAWLFGMQHLWVWSPEKGLRALPLMGSVLIPKIMRAL